MRRTWGMAVLVVLLVAGCSGGDDEGSPEPEPSASLSPADVVGTWTEDGEPPNEEYMVGVGINLQLNADGSASGYDGCNGGSGTWSLEGDTVVLDREWITTLRACETRLAELPSTIEVRDDTLVVPARDDEEPFVLQRVEA